MLELRRLIFEFTANQPIPANRMLPASTLRGAMGYALAQLNERAALRGSSSVAEVLRTGFGPPGSSPEHDSGPRDDIRPFVLRSRFTRPDGRALLLECVLFGEAGQWAGIISQAMHLVGDMGIGASHPVRCRVNLLSDEFVDPDTDPGDADCVLIDFISPTRLGGRGVRCYGDQIPFEILAARGLDRLKTLADRYGGGFPAQIDSVALKRMAHGILSGPWQSGYVAARRRSSRTGDSVSISGFVGTMLYRGKLAPFMPLLAYLPWIHVGRSTVNGCGWVAVITEGGEPV